MRAQSTLLGNVKVPANQSRWIERLARVLNKNVSFGSTMNNTDDDRNLDIWKFHGTSPGTANTDFTVQHSLGRVPITIIGQDTTNGGLIYRGSIAWTKTSVTFRSTGVSSVYNVIVA